MKCVYALAEEGDVQTCSLVALIAFPLLGVIETDATAWLTAYIGFFFPF